MARYKHIDTSPRFIAIDLQKQLLPGTFEHALNHLIDHVLDLTRFDARYHNDLTGASAYPPAPCCYGTVRPISKTWNPTCKQRNNNASPAWKKKPRRCING